MSNEYSNIMVRDPSFKQLKPVLKFMWKTYEKELKKISFKGSKGIKRLTFAEGRVRGLCPRVTVLVS